MANQQRLQELLAKWQELRDQGQFLSAEQVCAEDPEYVASVRERIAVLMSMESFLQGLTNNTPTGGEDGTRDRLATPVATPGVSAKAPASGPEFLKLAQSLHLLGADQVQGRQDRLHRSPKEWAAELIQANALTPFQANLLLKGRGQELLLGAYVLLERLGEGGMGAVYKARNWKLDRVVALKVIRKERLVDANVLRRFVREIQLAAQLDHPNIVRALDADCAGNTHFFVMEHIDGIDLARVVRKQGPLSVAHACDYIRQAALGLQHAFARGLVHRDIKPHNLLLMFSREPAASAGNMLHDGATSALAAGSRLNGVVKILDLGLARLSQLDSGDSASALTREGTVMGTPDYISPEQAQDAHTADIRADLYSLGCTFYFLLTGQPPFAGGTITEKLVRHWQHAPPDVRQLRSDVPAPVAAVVRRLLAKKPEDRYQTPEQLALALENLDAESIASSATLVSTGASANPFGEIGEEPTALDAGRVRAAAAQRRPWVLPGIAVAILLLGLGTYLWLRSRQAEPDVPPDHVHQRLVFKVQADQLWQDTGIDLVKDQPVKVTVKGEWSKCGLGKVPAWGLKDMPRDRCVQHDAPALCLIGRLGQAEPFALETLGIGAALMPAQSGRLFVQANDLDVADMSGEVQLILQGAGAKAGDGAQTMGLAPVQLAGKEYQQLLAKLADPKMNRAELWQEILTFLATNPSTYLADRAQHFFLKLPSPLDALDAKEIPVAERYPWQPSELVAVIGTHAKRHWGAVHAMAYHPGGKFVAIGGDDGIRLWDAETFKEITRITDDKCLERALTFSADGKMLASCTERDGVTVWEVKGTHLQKKLIKLDAANHLFPLAFSPDGSLLAGQKQGVVKIWNVSGGTAKLLCEAKCHGPGWNFLGFLHDGKTLVMGGEDKTVRFWDVPTLKEKSRLPDVDGPATLAVSSDGKTLAVSEQKANAIILWDVSGAIPKHSAKLKDSGLFYRLSFSHDGKKLAASNMHGVDARRVSVWRISQPEEGPISFVYLGTDHAIAPDGAKLVASSSYSRTNLIGLLRWCTVADQGIKELEPLFGNHFGYQPMDFAPAGNALLFGDGWHGASHFTRFGEAAPSRPAYFHSGVQYGTAFALDGNSFLTTSYDKIIGVWRFKDGTKIDSVEVQKAGHLYQIGLMQGGRLAVVAGDDAAGKPQLFAVDLKQGKLGPPRTFAVKGPYAHYARDGRTMTTSHYLPGNGQIWDVGMWPPRERKLSDVGSPFNGSIPSADGRRLLSSHVDGQIRTWDLTPADGSIRLLHTWEKQPPIEGWGCLAPDGSSFASPIGDRKVVWRSMPDGKVVQEWTFPGRVHRVLFAPDGRHLVTANSNGTLYILRLRANQGEQQ